MLQHTATNPQQDRNKTETKTQEDYQRTATRLQQSAIYYQKLQKTATDCNMGNRNRLQQTATWEYTSAQRS